jgi:AcrR family transcriptional regulator
MPPDVDTPSHKPATRERLIAAAFSAVAKHGFDGASVKHIAAEAQVTPGLLHYHFPTRDALLEAALRQALDDYLMRSRERRERTPRDQQITALFNSARESLQSDCDMFRVRLCFAAKALSSSPMAAVLKELNHAAVEETAMTFAAFRGASHPSPRDLSLAAAVKAAFDGYMLTWLADPEFPISAAGEILERAVRGALSAAD